MHAHMKLIAFPIMIIRFNMNRSVLPQANRTYIVEQTQYFSLDWVTSRNQTSFTHPFH